ncbi:MAG: chemotaxis protein CheC [Clostridiales bacterium]|nr:chemotaxis protein CheC [Clostridiales bacterium]
MRNNFESLSELQIDVLREIGNIGAGNAATTLSTMLAKKVDMTVPHVRIVDIQEIANILGGPENQVVGILFMLSEDIDGMMMFILEQKFAHLIINNLMGRNLESFLQFEEIDLSALKEIGNIMAGAYVNAISGLTNLSIYLSVPSIAIDMAGAILSVPAIEFGKVGDKVLFIEEEFIGDDENVSSYLILIPEMNSLHKILKILGVEI